MMLLLDKYKELLLLNFRRERMSLFKLVDIKKLCPVVATVHHTVRKFHRKVCKSLH